MLTRYSFGLWQDENIGDHRDAPVPGEAEIITERNRDPARMDRPKITVMEGGNWSLRQGLVRWIQTPGRAGSLAEPERKERGALFQKKE